MIGSARLRAPSGASFRRTVGVVFVMGALACGGGGSTEPDPVDVDAGMDTPRVDAGTPPSTDDAGTMPETDAGPLPSEDAGTTPDEDGGAPCPEGYAGADCTECAPGFFDFGDVCVIGCDAEGADALACGVGGECMISPADGSRFCACLDGFEGEACDTCREGWTRTGSRCTLDLPPGLGLTLWLDGDDADSIDVDGGMQVTAWRDRRELGGLSAAPTAASTRPLFRPTGRNGRGALDFDGVDDQLALSNFTGLGSTDVEVIVAGEFAGDTPTGVFAALTGTSGWTFLVERTTAKDFRVIYRSTPGASGGVEATVVRNAPSRPMYVSATHQTSAAVDSLAIFAADDPMQAAGVLPISDGSARLPSPINLRFGRTQNGRLRGRMYEVLVYSRRLSVDERAQVALYLREKWNLP